MLYEEWKLRYKNLKNFNTVLQRCPRFWPLTPPRGMNPGVYSLGISEDPPRYLSSKFDASVRSDCWDISIWKTLTQCDGNGNANANANANANVDDRGDYNSSPCTSYRRAKKSPCNNLKYFSYFPQKIGFNISCKLSLNWHEMLDPVFWESNKNINNLSTVVFVHSILSVRFLQGFGIND